VPLAAAVKLTLLPAATVWLVGSVVTAGAEFAGPVLLEEQPTIIRQTLRAQMARKTPAVRQTKLEFASISTTSY
jgi:hypothetical protein